MHPNVSSTLNYIIATRLTEAGEKEAFEAFKRHGFRFVRVEVA